jgi:membrane protease subunit HflK
MPDPNAPNQRPDDAFDPEQLRDLGPVEEESLEVEGPRRAASAQFVVEGDAAAGASLREAMDPANQSLAEALRLSYRVLQVVILVLIVLFIFSGWKSVRSDQTGVLTVWGDIVEVDGARALTPGLKFSRWPYPAGEFILFQEENLAVDLARPGRQDRPFWPMLRPNQTFEEAVSQASVNDRIRPGRDGALLTRDAELAHLQMTARYAIADPVQFVERVSVEGSDADRIVQLALERAVVHAGAAQTVEDVTERTEAFAEDVRGAAQDLLDAIDCGILLQAVNVPRATAPLAIRKTIEELQQASIQVEESLERARQQANETLTAVAGPQTAQLWRLIQSYQEAADGGDDGLAEQRLGEIAAMLDQTEGGVAGIIQQARSYRSEVESTLGADARYFASLLPAFRRQPDMVVKRLWLEAYGRVLARQDAEIIYAPNDIAAMHLKLYTLERIANLRRDRALQRQEQESTQSVLQSMGLRTRRARDMQLEGPGRTLEVTEEGGVRGRGGG